MITPYFQTDDVVLYCGDCLEILPTLGKVDAVVTDPPYGIPVGAAFVRRAGREVMDGSGGFNDTRTPYAWVAHAVPLVVDGGHVAVFVDRATCSHAESSLIAAGATPWHKYYLVKKAPPPTPRPCFVSAVEECVVAEKRNGKRRWFGGGYRPNRWIGLTPNRLNKSHGHPSEKPLDPMVDLVESLADVSHTILDPFMGSGTTGVACVKTGRKFIGIELDPTYCEIAKQRIEKALAERATSLHGVSA